MHRYLLELHSAGAHSLLEGCVRQAILRERVHCHRPGDSAGSTGVCIRALDVTNIFKHTMNPHFSLYSFYTTSSSTIMIGFGTV